MSSSRVSMCPEVPSPVPRLGPSEDRRLPVRLEKAHAGRRHGHHAAVVPVVGAQDEAAPVRLFPHRQARTGRTPGFHDLVVGSVAGPIHSRRSRIRLLTVSGMALQRLIGPKAVVRGHTSYREEMHVSAARRTYAQQMPRLSPVRRALPVLGWQRRPPSWRRARAGRRRPRRPRLPLARRHRRLPRPPAPRHHLRPSRPPSRRRRQRAGHFNRRRRTAESSTRRP